MKSFCELGAEVGALVDAKNSAYGDAFSRGGRVLRELYPDGITPEAMDDALGVVRVIDKLFRIAAAGGRPDPMAESPWRDIAGYGLLGYERARGQR